MCGEYVFVEFMGDGDVVFVCENRCVICVDVVGEWRRPTNVYEVTTSTKIVCLTMLMSVCVLIRDVV